MLAIERNPAPPSFAALEIAKSSFLAALPLHFYFAALEKARCENELSCDDAAAFRPSYLLPPYT
jgi:hypothetical protein